MHEGRRDFLKAAAGLTALSQQRILGANDTIRVGGIGVGLRCSSLLKMVNDAGGTAIVAVCDAYEPRRKAAIAKLAPQAREFTDYRELLARKDIDAVVIGAPDHWHVPMTIDAVRAGKDVYVEKPVSHTIEEGERLLAAMAGSRQIVQVGYQQRSWEHYRLAREVIQSGKLGKISMVLSSWYQDYLTLLAPIPEIERDKLDWKSFLGSARDQPFELLRFARWRWFWDFGGGHLTDLFSHWGDVIHWVMGHESPEAVQAMGGSNALPKFECPDTINAVYSYPGYHVVYDGTLVGSLEGGNIVFRGSDAMMKLNRSGFVVYPERVVAFENTQYPEPEISVRSRGDGTPAHVKNFLDCVRSRKEPNAGVKTSVASARAAHLGNLAYRKVKGKTA